ncbi:MAG: phosphodiester glycosidase family protein, partial [Mobilicoccus sp.]|nr:phosphodiester glycosidase family protein [Mobilicoccus sp.]
PWIVNVATIAPGARGQLRTAIGADIARTEGVSTLGRWSKSHVAVNGSYFHSGRRTAPGDMVGVAVNGGTIISQPQRVAGHVGVIMDSATKALTIGPMTWGATLTSDTGELRPDAVNTPLVNPAGCDTAGAPCTVRGQVVRFTPHYAAATPSGVGAEIVYDRQGCVVRTSRTRGTRLTAAQTSFQATGTLAEELLRVGGQGCPTYREALYGADRQRIPLTRTSFGVTGRYQLVSGGQIVAPAHTSAFFQRHPRTIIGRRADGTVLLVTVDGRSTTSVGVTLTEAARLARSLGLVDAANLDGGGSTAMAVRGRLVNTPPGGERSVADAVVFMP